MNAIQSSSSFQDVFDTVDNIRMNYSLNIKNTSSNFNLAQSSQSSSLLVEPFIEFKKSGQLKLVLRVYDKNSPSNSVVIESHVLVAHEIPSPDIQQFNIQPQVIENNQCSTPQSQENERALLFLQYSLSKQIEEMNQMRTILDDGQQEKDKQLNQKRNFRELEKGGQQSQYLPFKQKKCTQERESYKDEHAGSTASQEYSNDNQFQFNLSPTQLSSALSSEKSNKNNSNLNTIANNFKNIQNNDYLNNSRRRNQLEQLESTVSLESKKKSQKTDEVFSSANQKGNAVNMAKNILKGFMDYVFVSAQEKDIIECCSSEYPNTEITNSIENDLEEEDDLLDIKISENYGQNENVTINDVINENIQEPVNGSVETIRKRFKKQYNQKLLEKPSNSKLLKLFANNNYGRLFKHYFNSEEIMKYIESSNIQNKLAHKDLVEKIRSTSFDLERLQDVLKTRIFKRPPFQKPQK